MRFQRRATLVFGILTVLLGVALLAETARAGGGQIGYVVGALFLALGAGRLYLLHRR